MRVICEIGAGKTQTFVYPSDTKITPNKPMHGWLCVEGEDGRMLGWFNGQVVVAILPPEEKK